MPRTPRAPIPATSPVTIVAAGSACDGNPWASLDDPPLRIAVRIRRTSLAAGRPRAPFSFATSAVASTSSIDSTGTKVMLRRIFGGSSSRSALFFAGRMIVRIPARCAARIFSLRPPIGSTRPRSVISPVIATSLFTGVPVSAEISEVAIVTPAEGPSLGIAPAGTWMWMSCFAWKSGSMPRLSARERA